ncbi:DivIVA domain-containing protein [Aciditerrimonas ferrireducens]|uniref:DivIVA domain-containing protein n=1 Tax=Aciditerrimonas ferrireducens TaxID=667306 RepID=A0ABV6C317_9ACTN
MAARLRHPPFPDPRTPEGRATVSTGPTLSPSTPGIRPVRFHATWRGYDRQQVDAYVAHLHAMVDALRRRASEAEAAWHRLASQLLVPSAGCGAPSSAERTADPQGVGEPAALATRP